MRFAALGSVVIFASNALLAGDARTEQAARVPPVDTTRRDVGTGLSVGGLVLGSVGAGMYFLTQPRGDDRCGCASNAWVLPTVLISLGGAMTITGIPLWITGKIQTDRAKTRAQLQIGPLGGGVRLLF